MKTEICLSKKVDINNVEKVVRELREAKKKIIRDNLKFEEDHRFCLYCGKKLKKAQRRKYCSELCQSRYRYSLLKDDLKFKERNKKRYRAWRKKNRIHFNELVLPKVKKFNKKRYWDRKKKNLCTSCGKKLTDKYSKCSSCREKSAGFTKKFWKRRGRYK